MILVNQTTIPEQTILAEMQYHPAESQRDALIKAAESLIIAELLKQRANSLNITLCDDETLASENDYLEALIEHEIDIPVAAQKECAHYFEQNKKRFTSSPILEVQHILIAAAPEDENGRIEAKLKADELIIQLHKGKSFEEVAALESDCPSKNEGGDLGQISRGQTVPELERQLMLASVGLLARPIETRYGFHVAKINRITPGSQLELTDVEDSIAQYLNEKVRRKAIAGYIQNLISDAEIEGYDFNVAALPASVQ
jgi:peptidyl-prolyl cis-trans isomerase C